MTKPLALMDVDGVLNLWAYVSRRSGFHVSEEPNDDGSFAVSGHDFSVMAGRFDIFHLYWRSDLPTLVERLRRTFDIVWATTWNNDANDYWLSRMGLAEPLPMIHLDVDDRATNPALCWKTPQVNRWLVEHHGTDVVGVWFDDEVSRRDRPHLPERMLPIHTFDHLGLTPENIWHAEKHVAGLSHATRVVLDLLDITEMPEGDFDTITGMLLNLRNAEHLVPSHHTALSLFNLRHAAGELARAQQKVDTP